MSGRIPDAMTMTNFGDRRSTWRTALLLAVWCLCLVVACAPREERIEISKEGADLLIASCEKPTQCAISETNVRPDGDQFNRMLAQLMMVSIPKDAKELTIEATKLEAVGPCMQLCCCEFDRGRQEAAECIAKAINDALDKNLPEGLGFDGLKSTEDVLLIVALYNPGDRYVDPGAPDCRASELFACSGLENVTGSYDILCSSCVSGPRSTTNQGPPCLGDCFIRACHQFVKHHLDGGAR